MVTAVQQLGEDVAKSAAAPLWPLSDDELVAWLRAAHRIEQAAVVLQARLLRQATVRGVPARQGHRGPAGWLRSMLLLDARPARELTASAATVGRRPEVEQAVLDGRMNWRQAAAIAAAVESIPAEAGTFDAVRAGDDCAGDEDESGHTSAGATMDAGAVEAEAERVLIDMAGRLTATQLTRVGDRILTHVAPELGTRAEQAYLARQEARAHTRRELHLSAPVDGLVRLSGFLGAEDAATVRAALHPLCGPTPDDARTPGQRRADALVDICRLALRTGELPEHGGQPAQLSVTVAYDPLTHALGTATTDTGERLSAAAARRLACDAQILPHVLGGAGQILDAGRTRRLATTPLRRALAVRDRGCAFPDCDRPPGWTDAHHITAWTTGGPTTLNNLVLLCRTHHRLIHDPAADWHIHLGPDETPEFIPPPHVDPQQRPRQNLYHLRL
ncbi:HNH endonuclease signature motif containing protein [Paractinoplanes maris]|uniref:HNH endonuclease signature motif containing protein n=1 Tax=Paractinoplanes maris TaxID=1734446 RepID=UPI0020216676|nr:HNH endonuclease signature motif containing protein [Actinoplanes maris]